MRFNNPVKSEAKSICKLFFLLEHGRQKLICNEFDFKNKNRQQHQLAEKQQSVRILTSTLNQQLSTEKCAVPNHQL